MSVADSLEAADVRYALTCGAPGAASLMGCLPGGHFFSLIPTMVAGRHSRPGRPANLETPTSSPTWKASRKTLPSTFTDAAAAAAAFLLFLAGGSAAAAAAFLLFFAMGGSGVTC